MIFVSFEIKFIYCFKGVWRNPSFALMITGIHTAMALFVGLLFFNVGEDATYVRDNYNFLYFSLMFLMFTAFTSVSINCEYIYPC